eukprot:comp22494_c0_seq2/m.55974 comp22494_c0_seq2/g.55974  ORF comp22494_c0_seq2/g.55974 comp22494_c0_seq2/m.55974 type:complete len:498 (+) comp22494_c0_seq2:1826-3319(+)
MLPNPELRHNAALCPGPGRQLRWLHRHIQHPRGLNGHPGYRHPNQRISIIHNDSHRRQLWPHVVRRCSSHLGLGHSNQICKHHLMGRHRSNRQRAANGHILYEKQHQRHQLPRPGLHIHLGPHHLSRPNFLPLQARAQLFNLRKQRHIDNRRLGIRNTGCKHRCCRLKDNLQCWRNSLHHRQIVKRHADHMRKPRRRWISAQRRPLLLERRLVDRALKRADILLRTASNQQPHPAAALLDIGRQPRDSCWHQLWRKQHRDRRRLSLHFGNLDLRNLFLVLGTGRRRRKSHRLQPGRRPDQPAIHPLCIQPARILGLLPGLCGHIQHLLEHHNHWPVLWRTRERLARQAGAPTCPSDKHLLLHHQRHSHPVLRGAHGPRRIRQKRRCAGHRWNLLNPLHKGIHIQPARHNRIRARSDALLRRPPHHLWLKLWQRPGRVRNRRHFRGHRRKRHLNPPMRLPGLGFSLHDHLHNAINRRNPLRTQCACLSASGRPAKHRL